ncbi:Glucose-6-phosphate isomerase cytosolic 1, partial [Nymphaea thermarum]
SLAARVRNQLSSAHANGAPIGGFNYSTTWLLTKYLEGESLVGSCGSTSLPNIEVTTIPSKHKSTDHMAVQRRKSDEAHLMKPKREVLGCGCKAKSRQLSSSFR